MNCLKINIDKDAVARGIESQGFYIARNAVSDSFVIAQKNKWIDEFKFGRITKKFVRGNLVLGEPNFLSYSDIPAWCMYRKFDFLWNECNDKEFQQIHISLHKIRNEIQGMPSNYGLEYCSTSYGIYFSTSLYEPNKGHLVFHTDGHQQSPILHYMLPITFKGEDYIDGGLFCYGKNGVEYDIDEMVYPGDVIFFDGRMKHGVKKIVSDRAGVGRIAQFAVPTYFEKDANWSVFRRSLIVAAREFANSLGITKLY